MYHGKAGDLELHPGLCLTDDFDIAADYAIYGSFGDGKAVHTVEIDLTGLTVVEVEDFDRDENFAAGDDYTAFGGADIIVYKDETIRGQAHTTWRLMSDAALAALRPVSTTDTEEL